MNNSMAQEQKTMLVEDEGSSWGQTCVLQNLLSSSIVDCGEGPHGIFFVAEIMQWTIHMETVFGV